jgi:CRP-like cAMP-binding protein
MALLTTAMTGPLYDALAAVPVHGTPDPREGMVGALGKGYYRNIVHAALHELTDEQADAVSSELEVIDVSAGETVVREGEPADRFYIIVEGELEVTRIADGGARLVDRLGAGQFFGEIGLLEQRARTATVTARTSATLLSMDENQFRGLLGRSLSTSRGLEAIVEERLRSL